MSFHIYIYNPNFVTCNIPSFESDLKNSLMKNCNLAAVQPLADPKKLMIITHKELRNQRYEPLSSSPRYKSDRLDQRLFRC